jgi:hypothetical protein
MSWNGVLVLPLLAVIPPPAPSPNASRDIAVCRIGLELPRGSIVVANVCWVASGNVRCDGEEVITVAEFPAYAEDTETGVHGILLPPTEYWVREERYIKEVRYLLVSDGRPNRKHPYLSLPSPAPMERLTRACPEGSLFLEKGQDVVILASGSGVAHAGESLKSFTARNDGGPWLIAVFSRVK